MIDELLVKLNNLKYHSNNIAILLHRKFDKTLEERLKTTQNKQRINIDSSKGNIIAFTDRRNKKKLEKSKLFIRE